MGRKSFSVEKIFKKRPKIKDYATLEPEVKEYVDRLIKTSIKANHILRLKEDFITTKNIKPKKLDFWQMKWSDIITLKNAVKETNITVCMGVVYGINELQFLSLDVFNCFSCYKWVVDSLREVNDIEARELGTEISEEEKNAGVEMLEEFGYAVTLDVLSKGDILKHNKLLEKPYSIIFRQMCLNATNSQIRKNHQENVNRKAKSNSRRKGF